MEKKEQIGRTEAFLQQVILAELDQLQQLHLSYMPFVIMGQVIEVLGSFLDQKPMKAKGQSAHRFSVAVSCLFGGKYRLLNDRNFLYDKLRNQMTHTFIPGQDLVLFRSQEEAGDYSHLDVRDGQLVLIADVFYRDIHRACERLIILLKEGRIKPKPIAFGDER